MVNFRKSKKIGPIRLNLSKSGLGVSAGVKGLTFGVDSKGKAYRAASIPGTGIYTRNYIKNTSNNKNSSTSGAVSNVDLLGFDYPTEQFRESDGKGCLKIFAWIISIILIPFIIGIFTTIGLIIYNYTKNKKPQTKFRKHFLNGVISAKTGNISKALNDLSQAENFNNENEYLIDLKGVCLYKSENYEQALSYFLKLDQISPSERTKLLLAETYRKIENPEDYSKIIELNKLYLENHPHDSETLFLTGFYSYKIKEYNQAISYLQKITEDEPLFLQSLNATASCFYEKNEIDNAIGVLQKAPLRKRNLDSDLLDTHYLLGSLYLENNDKQNALKHLKKVVLEDITYKDANEKIELIKNEA